jgi:WD40 repeat protein/transcriptional regulator with XRE-family HTH domain
MRSTYKYRERDYAFGNLCLTLRSRIGVTQGELALLLKASERTIQGWEAGESYPKVESLKRFIELCVQRHAFSASREQEEIRKLWQAAHQRVLLDENWLRALLSSPPTTSHTSTNEGYATPGQTLAGEPAAFPRIDWVGALDVSHFTGREVELADLSQWVLQERCRLIVILGMGGIGKSALVSLLGQRLAGHFDAVLWRSVRDAPPCEDLVADCVAFCSESPPSEPPTLLERRIDQLVGRLQERRYLLVLDNLESLLNEGDLEGGYREGYAGYERLIQRLAETAHQSCVLITSREKPKEVEPLEGVQSPVRSLRLSGLDEGSARALLSDKGLVGEEISWKQLTAAYAGNPLALKIVAQTIADLFGGDITQFLQSGELSFNGIRAVLRKQVGRLTPLERVLLTWLAITREWTSLDALLGFVIPQVVRGRAMEALEALRRRSLIELGTKGAIFTLQSVVLEYVTTELILEITDEIEQGRLKQLIEYALCQAGAKEYIRQTQERLILAPVLAGLQGTHQGRAQVDKRLLVLLTQLREQADHSQGYGPANLIALLRAHRGHLRNLDLSHLVIRGAYLQGVEMQDTSLVAAKLRDTIFTEAFDAMWAVAISGNGQYWAAGSRRGEVRVWREGGLSLHLSLRAHTDCAVAVAFDPQGSRLATASWDGTIKMWDLEHGNLLWTDWHTCEIFALAFAPDGQVLASGEDDATVRLWNAASGTLLETLPHPGPVFSLAWSPDGHMLASGGFDGGIRLWKLQATQLATCVAHLSGHTNWVHGGLVFSPDGKWLVSGSSDRTVKLWEVVSGRCLQTFVGHTDWVSAVAWSPDGRTVASCGWDHTIWLWEVDWGSYRAVLHGHTDRVYSITFTPDSVNLLSGSEDGTLRVWDVVSGQCVRVLEGYEASLYDVAWSPDGMRLASAGSDTLLTVWEVADGKLARVLHGHRWSVQGVAWSPDGGTLASSGWDNAIRLWDPTKDNCVGILRDPDASDTVFKGVAWSPDGRLLANGSFLRGVQVWEMTARTRRWVCSAPPTLIHRVEWSPDGTRLASGGDDGCVCLWEASEGALLQRLQGHRGMVYGVAWSPDGTWLASGGGGSGELFVWDAHSGERLKSLVGSTGIVFAVEWGPRGDLLISGDSDGMLRWWDVQSDECVMQRQGHEGAVRSLRISPDGHSLASCGEDGALKVWEMESGQLWRILRRDRPYERLNITGMTGLTEAQKATLLALGAVEEPIAAFTES